MSKNFEKTCANLGRELRIFGKDMKTLAIKYANVISVDKEANTMGVIIGGTTELIDVPLCVSTGVNGSTLSYPAIDSLIILGFCEDVIETVFPVAFSEIEETVIRNNFDNEDDLITINATTIDIKRGSSTIKIENDLITFNGGSLDGLIKIVELTAKVNEMQGEIDSINSDIKSHTHPYIGALHPGPPAETSASSSLASISNLTPFDKDDYENTNIIQ